MVSIEPHWPDEGQNRRLRLLCAQCVGLLCMPSVYAKIAYRQDPPRILTPDFRPGRDLVEAARCARDDGHPVMIDEQLAGIYADTMIGGMLVCTDHVYFAARATGKPFPL